MLKFVPVNYTELVHPYCEDCSLNGYVGYDLADNNSVCGNCVFRINGYSMEILYIDVKESDPEVIEGLIRSALNFGGNRNVYIAQFKAQNGVEVAKLLGFKSENSVLTGDIPTLLKGSCCKGN